ncbi:hypothetical protein F5X68DRAFT_263278 [Plectosphaerella plurivora]|uniref:Fungal N-terminal domain-containing protein n=1 Tax=Plectosphaerella plurivora TaxID=936078 RepID=A0A9P9A8C6_9PEZI|nr:hypothetical protein F5X68DRAFT_263278 [Plectosphaerella plurivora]
MEVFGVVAGAAGLITVLPTLTSGLEMLRQVRDLSDKFPTEIEGLANDLELLITFLDALQKSPDTNEPALLRCTSCCRQIADDLEGVKGRLLTVTTGSRRRTIVRKITGLPGLRAATEQLRGSISNAQSTMIM